ncbi:MAG: IPT/TIG domain-containing protein [Bacteroidota bacterium]
MKKTSIKLFSFGRKFGAAALLLAASFVAGCAEDPSPTQSDQYAEDFQHRPAPVVSSISPDNSSIAGVGIVTISGSGFSTVPAENIVYFGGKPGTVLSASATQLVVKAPNNPKDSLDIKIALRYSENFSNSIVKFKLIPAVTEINKLKDTKYYALAADNSGNLYAQVTGKGDANLGFWKISPDGTVDKSFAPKAVNLFNSMKVGPGGKLYGAIRKAVIYEITQGSTKPFVSSGLGNINDFDFDQNLNIWAGGKDNTSIYRIGYNDKKIEKFAFDEDVLAVRVFDNYLYIASQKNSVQSIWRFKINGSSLGEKELYFDYTTKYGNENSITAITFSSNGSLLVGVTGTDKTKTYEPFILIAPDKSSSFFYQELVADKIYTGGVVSLTWGAGDNIFYVREFATKQSDGSSLTTQEIVKVLSQMQSAPYFGR